MFAFLYLDIACVPIYLTVVTNSTVYSDDVRWSQLEESCILKSQGTLPLIINRSIPSHNKNMKNTQSPRAILAGWLL